MHAWCYCDNQTKKKASRKDDVSDDDDGGDDVNDGGEDKRKGSIHPPHSSLKDSTEFDWSSKRPSAQVCVCVCDSLPLFSHVIVIGNHHYH